MIEIHACNSTRRTLCIHRAQMVAKGLKSECCTNANNVLKGCPMLQREAGCLMIGSCKVTSESVVNKGGKKFLKIATCEHHPDRFPIKANPNGSSEWLNAASNGDHFHAQPQPVQNNEDEEE